MLRTCCYVVAIRGKVNGQHLFHMALQQEHAAASAAVPDPACGTSRHGTAQHSVRWRGGAQGNMSFQRPHGAALSEQYTAVCRVDSFMDPAL